MKPMPDPVFDELREVSHQISASFDHDLAKLVAYLMQYQKQYKDRLVYIPDDPTPASIDVQPTGDAVTSLQHVSVS